MSKKLKLGCFHVGVYVSILHHVSIVLESQSWCQIIIYNCPHSLYYSFRENEKLKQQRGQENPWRDTILMM